MRSGVSPPFHNRRKQFESATSAKMFDVKSTFARSLYNALSCLPLSEFVAKTEPLGAQSESQDNGITLEIGDALRSKGLRRVSNFRRNSRTALIFIELLQSLFCRGAKKVTRDNSCN